jgi:hypothetical protein
MACLQADILPIDWQQQPTSSSYNWTFPPAALGDLVRTLEEKEANLGLRVVLETMLRRFNDRHFAGQCTDASCQAYI